MCNFSDQDDIVRNMMKCLAADEVWQNISWMGTPYKASFTGRFGTLHQLISDVCSDTFKECTKSFIESKIKTFLRHTEERIKRKAVREANPEKLPYRNVQRNKEE